MLSPVRKLDLTIHGLSESIETTIIKDLAVTEAKLADASVATAKLQDASVTHAKLAADAVKDVNVAADAHIEATKIASADAPADAAKSLVDDLQARTVRADDETITGHWTFSNVLDVSGDFAVATDKFTVDSATGDTVVGGTLSVTGETTLTGNVLASGDLTVQGNLAVNGTTTSVNSVDLVVNDRLVHLNEPATAGENDPVPTGLSGISVHRGSDAGVEREHAGMVWDEAAQKFVLQFLAEDVAGSGKLNLEAKDIWAQNLTLNAVDNEYNSNIQGSAYRFELDFNTSAGTGQFDLDASGIGVDVYDNAGNGVYVQAHPDQFHIERTADDYETWSQFDIDVDGVRLRDQDDAPMLPTLDEHLVVKKYVDDAGDALQANIDLKFDKAGGAIDIDGTVQLSATDASSVTLSGGGLEIASDHVVSAPDLAATTQFGLDTVSMSWNLDSGEAYSASLESGSLNLSFDSGAGEAFNLYAQSNNFQVQQVLAGDESEITSNATLIQLRAGESNADFIVLDVTKDGARLVNRDNTATDTVFMPTLDEHLVVKKYVDDAIDALDSSSNDGLSALQDELDATQTGAGLEADGSYAANATANYIDAATSLKDADNQLDQALKSVEDRVLTLENKTIWSAFIDSAAGGETSLAKPVGAPAIPNSELTEFYVDGRKSRRSSGTPLVERIFTVAADGSEVTFAALAEGQDVELRYWA